MLRNSLLMVSAALTAAAQITTQQPASAHGPGGSDGGHFVSQGIVAHNRFANHFRRKFAFHRVLVAPYGWGWFYDDYDTYANNLWKEKDASFRPLVTYQAGETVFATGTKTGRLLILRKGAVTIEKEGTEIATVSEPGAVFGELSALLNQPHTADVRTLEASEFRVARDPIILLYVAAILAQRLNLANQTVIELKSQIRLHFMTLDEYQSTAVAIAVGSTIGAAVKRMEEVLSETGT